MKEIEHYVNNITNGFQPGHSEKHLYQGIPKLQNEIKEVKQRLNQIVKENTILRQDIDTLRVENRELTNQLRESTRGGKRSNRMQDFVGFTAFADGDVTYSEGETIRFQQTIINVGSGYDIVNHVFTCPVTGMVSIYIF